MFFVVMFLGQIKTPTHFDVLQQYLFNQLFTTLDKANTSLFQRDSKLNLNKP